MTYTLSRLWVDKLNNFRIKKIMRRKIYGQWGILRQCIKYMNFLVDNKFSDYEIYKCFHKIYDNIETEKDKAYNRALSRVNDIIPYISYHTKYLDIGCLDGNITRHIHDHLMLSNKEIESFGIDVNDIEQVDTSNFKLMKYDGVRIPFGDNTFDLITIFMVLHHVENVKLYLSEVYRVMKAGGTLIIREHNIDSQDMKDIVDIQHNFYTIDSETSMKTHQYNSQNVWSELIESVGFKLVSGDTECSSYLTTNISGNTIIINPFQVFYSVYVK